MSFARWIVLCILIFVFSTNAITAEVIEIRQPFDFFKKVRWPNTIYEIRCEVDLINDTVRLFQNVTLHFLGGKIKNGTLIGYNTTLSNSSNLPIFDKIDIGSLPYQFINDAIYVDWFEGKSDADKTQSALDFAKKNRNAINFLSRQYVFDHTVVIAMGQIVLKGTGGGGEYQDLGTKIVSAPNFTSEYEGSPLFYVLGEPSKPDQTLGLVSGHITGITFATDKKHDVFQFLLSGAPSRPLFIDYCRFQGCDTAIRLLDNGKSVELGFLYVEHCTMKGNRWNIVAHGKHAMLGLYFCKNVAEQCFGNINLGYTETYSKAPFEDYAPKQQDYASSSNIVISDNLLEGTVDCIYINGGKCIVNIERNYFESQQKQFVVLSFSNPNSVVKFQDNFISHSDDVSLTLRNCRFSLQNNFSKSNLKLSHSIPIQYQ